MIVELIKPHSHAGQMLPIGARFDAPEAKAQWLITHGIAKAVSDKKRTSSTSTARKEG